MAELRSRPSGEEARAALAAVLEDQAARKRRRDVPVVQDKGVPFVKIAVIPLVVVAVWLVVAPPAVLRPPPPPAPTVEDVRNGLHMDIYAVAAQVFGYRDANGRLPENLVDALVERESAQGLTYTLGSDGTFEIAGERSGQVVVYRSTESLVQFAAAARAAIINGTGSRRP